MDQVDQPAAQPAANATPADAAGAQPAGGPLPWRLTYEQRQMLELRMSRIMWPHYICGTFVLSCCINVRKALPHVDVSPEISLAVPLVAYSAKGPSTEVLQCTGFVCVERRWEGM